VTGQCITIVVTGLPPKKDGAASMWRKPAEIPRIKALRLAAVEAMAGKPPLAGPLALTLRLYAECGVGDLDNFITGICDGLMAAHGRTPLDGAAWDDLPAAARPGQAIVYRDDAWVTKIVAERLPPAAGNRYEVEVRLLE